MKLMQWKKKQKRKSLQPNWMGHNCSIIHCWIDYTWEPMNFWQRFWVAKQSEKMTISFSGAGFCAIHIFLTTERFIKRTRKRNEHIISYSLKEKTRNLVKNCSCCTQKCQKSTNSGCYNTRVSHSVVPSKLTQLPRFCTVFHQMSFIA